ncbi:hypothetical protein OUZ56_019920 [Daphnia magna]|uniref:Uncharacterized protein n=1 Tax=Daphnia magna TaxID=35525 RepID=A0ABQ9ZD18_9CRUS|nr:hypothetical protein OUZ56_019920 [Daphnia magna]
MELEELDVSSSMFRQRRVCVYASNTGFGRAAGGTNFDEDGESTSIRIDYVIRIFDLVNQDPSRNYLTIPFTPD